MPNSGFCEEKNFLWKKCSSQMIDFQLFENEKIS